MSSRRDKLDSEGTKGSTALLQAPMREPEVLASVEVASSQHSQIQGGGSCQKLGFLSLPSDVNQTNCTTSENIFSFLTPRNSLELLGKPSPGLFMLVMNTWNWLVYDALLWILIDYPLSLVHWLGYQMTACGLALFGLEDCQLDDALHLALRFLRICFLYLVKDIAQHVNFFCASFSPDGIKLSWNRILELLSLPIQDGCHVRECHRLNILKRYFLRYYKVRSTCWRNALAICQLMLCLSVAFSMPNFISIQNPWELLIGKIFNGLEIMAKLFLVFDFVLPYFLSLVSFFYGLPSTTTSKASSLLPTFFYQILLANFKRLLYHLIHDIFVAWMALSYYACGRRYTSRFICFYNGSKMERFHKPFVYEAADEIPSLTFWNPFYCKSRLQSLRIEPQSGLTTP